MKQAEAKKWIVQHFGTAARFEKSQREHIEDEDFVAVLAHLNHLPQARMKDRETIERFLYAGCRKFDRWFAPSPPSVPQNFRRWFCAFANALSEFETVPMNAPVFAIHALRYELYAEIGGKTFPLCAADGEYLSDLEDRIGQIPVPEQPTKKAELLEVRSELNALISAVLSETLVTRFRTTVPYPLSRAPIDFTLQWNDLQVDGVLRSEFKAAPGLLTQTAAPSVIRPASSTRWQYGTSEFELMFHALIDPSIQVAPLQIPAIEVPVDAWPNGLRIAYELVYTVCWALRGHPAYIGIWVPAPGDIGEIESTIDLPGRKGYALIRRSNASMVHEIFEPSSQPVSVDLGAAHLLSWHQRCRILADQYAGLGEVREALFWLNVGVEALLRARMEAQIMQTNLGIDLDALDGSATYWDEARTLVAEKFPDLVDEITWPSGGKKPSLFQQLRYFCRNVPGAPDFNPIKSHYGKVSKNRNALFHGTSEAALSIEELKTAMNSFDWLETNF